MSVVAEIADAVVDELNAADFMPTGVTAERVYLPVYDTATMSGLKVWVLGTAEDLTEFTRSSYTHTYRIQVAIYKRVDPADTAAIDELSDFRERVVDLLKSKTQLTGYPEAIRKSVRNVPVYDPVHLDKRNTFVSLVTAEYILMRD